MAGGCFACRRQAIALALERRHDLLLKECHLHQPTLSTPRAAAGMPASSPARTPNGQENVWREEDRDVWQLSGITDPPAAKGMSPSLPARMLGRQDNEAQEELREKQELETQLCNTLLIDPGGAENASPEPDSSHAASPEAPPDASRRSTEHKSAGNFFDEEEEVADDLFKGHWIQGLVASTRFEVPLPSSSF